MGGDVTVYAMMFWCLVVDGTDGGSRGIHQNDTRKQTHTQTHAHTPAKLISIFFCLVKTKRKTNCRNNPLIIFEDTFLQIYHNYLPWSNLQTLLNWYAIFLIFGPWNWRFSIFFNFLLFYKNQQEIYSFFCCDKGR